MKKLYIFFILLFAFPTFSFSLAIDGIYSSYDFDSYNANDPVNGKNGTPTNVDYSDDYGFINAGARLNTTTSEIDLGANFGASGAEVTYNCWIYPTSFVSNYGAVIAKNLTGDSRFVAMYVKSDGKLAFYVSTVTNGDSSYDGAGSNTLSANTWYMMTMTYSNADGLRGYINGIQDGNALPAGFLDTNPTGLSVKIGSQNGYEGSRSFRGYIDECLIYDRAITSTEVTELYNAGEGYNPINEGGGGGGGDYTYNSGSLSTSDIFNVSSTSISFGAIDYSACDVTSISVDLFASTTLNWGTFNVPTCILQSFKLLLFGTNGFDSYNITNFVNSSSSTLPFLMFKFMGGSLIYINPITGQLINLPNASSSLVFSVPLFGTSSPFLIDITASSTYLTGLQVPEPIDRAMATIEMVVFFLIWAIIFRYINI